MGLIHQLGPPEPVAAPRPTLPDPGGYVSPMVIDDSKAVDPLEFWPNMIMRLALAAGFSAAILAVFFAIIYSFLRWVL